MSADTTKGYTGSTYYYDSPYKYTCWGYNDNVVTYNTTGVKVACPIVSEILGSSTNQPTYAKVRYHGLFSESKEAAQSNVKDSNIKKVVDNWYASNIYNKRDENNILLENYLSDEIFCNDRTTTSNGYLYSPRVSYAGWNKFITGTKYSPILKCADSGITGKVNNNKFTLKTNNVTSLVLASEIGNNMLTYPVGLITADEIAYGGSGKSTNNLNFYLYTGVIYWTMTPSAIAVSGIHSDMLVLNSQGLIYSNSLKAGYGARPVINLKSTVEYVSGTGTETNPYIISLP